MIKLKPAACGRDCNECASYKVTMQGDLKAAEEMLPWFRSQGIVGEDEGAKAVLRLAPFCTGCWKIDNDCYWKGCNRCGFRSCCIEKQIEHCGYCRDFPCGLYEGWEEKNEVYRAAVSRLLAVKEEWIKNGKPCPRCGRIDPQSREMCPYCGAPIKPIPVPPGGKIRFGRYDWFVLDKQPGRILIITEKVTEHRPYCREQAAVSWETGDIRSYLNGEFYGSFDEADRAKILEVTNENPDNPWYGTPGGNPTKDRIFLLSIGEVIKYFGDSGQIRTRYMYPNCGWCKDEFLPWIDDGFSVNRRAVDKTGVVRHYWLRSPGANEYCVATVMGFCGDGFDQGGILVSGICELEDGHFRFDGRGGTDKPCGVRPALWLKTDDT